LASILIAVRSVLLGFTASNCIVFGEYVLYAFKREPSQFEGKVLGLALLTTVVIIHSCFLRTGIFIQNVLGWLKIGLAIFMVFTSLFVVLFRGNEEAQHRPLPQTTTSHIWDGSVWNYGIITTAMFKVSYSYAGLSNVNSVLNEVKNPIKTLKSAALTALATSCLLYVLVNIAYFLVVPLEDIKDSGELIAALFFERVFGTDVGRVLLPLAIATSAAGNVMVVTFSHVSAFPFTASIYSQSSGTSDSRDSTTRSSSVWRLHRFDETIWRTDGSSDNPLHSLFPGHLHTCKEHLLIHT
jgi:amino acid transporter